MRIITKKAISAFNSGHDFRLDNTQVNQRIGGTELVLHRSVIAKQLDGEPLKINLCGYNTRTTRERLNGFEGVQLNVSKGQLYLNGEPIPDDEWISIAAPVNA